MSASNGTFAGAMEIYSTPAEISEIGKAFAKFPSMIPDNYVYEHGSADPAKRMYCYLRLRAYTVDGVGHCALQISMNANGAPPHEGVCEFSIHVEAAALNRLGHLLEHYSKLEHLELRWTPTDAYLDGDAWAYN